LAGERSGQTLRTGDVVLLPRGVPHVLADPPRAAPVPIESLPLCRTPGAGMPLLEIGQQAEPATELVCGAYLLEPAARPHPLLGALPEVVYLPGSRGAHPSLHTAVDLLAAELGRSRPGTTAVVEALINALLAYVLRAWFDQQPQRSPAWAALADPAVGAALVRLHDRPAAPWTVAGLAADVGLSRAAFARRFTSLIGEPPLAYLTRWRMTRARQLLRGGNATLAAVAHEVGYESPFAFAKAFKRHTGESPGSYRARHRADPPATDN
jgi:AraC-like DNA-binding protein